MLVNTLFSFSQFYNTPKLQQLLNDPKNNPDIKFQNNVLTVTISNISWREIYPFPSRSYIENAHFNFCSSFPLDVTDKAQRNSRKSIVPSPLASNVRNTCSANLLASPYGKKLPYIFLNSSTDRCPLGQSFRNPLYHS